MSQPDSVLIVEDEIELAEIFSEIIASMGLKTTSLRDGQAALDWLAQQAPGIVVLDLHLPRVSGKEVLAYIRAQPHLQQTRVMVVSADAIQLRELDDQVDMTLVKPASMDQIIRLTQRLLSS
jgi:CheY-like chemotaxis protein